ncbi:MAG: adenylate/guanylate cyclase domain-containing protein [Cyanobacteriota bacterium]|nr:adenylate/guanylate cyclase domain-containing protein [Cyanobacteriota bacterium]
MNTITIKLKKLIAKQGLADTIRDFIGDLETPIAIEDKKGKILLGDRELGGKQCDRHPIQAGEETIGWVLGDKKAQFLAQIIGHIAIREIESKSLAIDALDRYEEINFLYDFSSLISTCLDVREVTELVLDEARKLIDATSASVMLLNEESQQLEILAARGQEYPKKVTIAPGLGIAGHVFVSNKAEIVNNVQADPRYVPGENNIHSLLCAPLVTQNGAIGAINLANTNPVNYSAQDLKLFTALTSQAAAAIENALLHENKLKQERIKSHLQRYLSPLVVRAVIEAKEDLSLEPKKQNIAILFSDIRNFTRKCEELAPEQIVAYLNEYFTHMVAVIFAHQGTVNKFVGDMIVAMFGAPTRYVDREKKAIQAAIDMQRAIQKIPNPWIRDNFSTGIGICSGDVVVGNIGSPQHLDYTAIGDKVNVASRLQSMAQGGQILVNSSVYQATQDIFEFERLGSVKVKGRHQPIDAFRVEYDCLEGHLNRPTEHLIQLQD